MSLDPDTYQLPYDTRIVGGLYPGSTVELEGLILEQSKWFCVKIANGQYERAKALRLKAYLMDRYLMDIHIHNCFEERPPIKMPFKQKRRFLIKIEVTRDRYKMFLNDVLLDELPHCLLPKEANFLRMDGDVILERYTPPPQLR